MPRDHHRPRGIGRTGAFDDPPARPFDNVERVESQDYIAPRSLPEDRRSLGLAERDHPGSGPLRHVAEAWGGPLGRHAVVGRQRRWTPLRVVMLFAVVFLAFGFLSKAPCLETSQPTDGSEPGLMWDGRQYTRACYADPIPLWGIEGLSQGALPYKFSWQEESNGEIIDRYMEYPVVMGMWQYVSAQVALAWEQVDAATIETGIIDVIRYFVVVAIGMAFFWLVAVWATYKSAGRRPWDTLFMAASPLVVFQAFTNFDAMAVAASAVALLLWAWKKPVWAGVVLGIGIAAKLYPLFLFGALLVVAIRARRYMELAWSAIAAVATWGVINLPIALLFPVGWREFFRLNSERPANPESIYAIVQNLTGWQGWDPPGQPPEILNMVSLVIFAVCCLGVLAIGLAARTSPRVAQLAFLVVAAFLLTNKVWSPQYSLWLVPLALLAIPRARLLVPWMVYDALLWVAHMSYFSGQDHKGLNAEWFHVLVLGRNALVVAICVAIVIEIFRPERDVVRRWHQDLPGGDPLLGTLAPVPDAPPQVRRAFSLDDVRARQIRETAPAGASKSPPVPVGAADTTPAAGDAAGSEEETR